MALIVMPRLGVILPSSNTTFEAEFAKVLYESDITLHVSRIRLTEVTAKALSAMEKEIQTATRLLKDADADAIAFACTSGSLIKGLGYDAAIAEKISKIAKSPVVVTAGAVVAALNELGLRRISLATPYVDEVNKREVDFLEKSGFLVQNVKFLNLRRNLDIGNLDANDVAILARSADSDFSEALFISCTNLPTFELLPSLEEELQKPIVSSNSATLWAILKTLNSNFRPRLGTLFEVSRLRS
jgi:maleate isomerase